MAQTETDRKVANIERHWQTILLFAITAVLAFASKTLWESSAVQATLAVEVKNLTTQVAELRGQLTAMQQQYVTRPEFTVHEQRLQAIERGRR